MENGPRDESQDAERHAGDIKHHPHAHESEEDED